MLELEEAIKKAKEYVASIYGGSIDAIVEEVQLTDDRKYWLITLGWENLKKRATPLTTITEPARIYKVVYVNTDNGEVNKMIMRE